MARHAREYRQRLREKGEADTGSELNPLHLDNLKEAIEELQRQLLSKVLLETKGNVSLAARRLGISRPTVYELMARYGTKH